MPRARVMPPFQDQRKKGTLEKNICSQLHNHGVARPGQQVRQDFYAYWVLCLSLSETEADWTV